MLPAILPMRPLFVEKLWGGTRMQTLPAKQRSGHAPPAGARIGEAWEVADLPEGCSVIDGGPLHGMTLRDASERFGRELVGRKAQPGPDGLLRFPLLVKIIDANDDLSVQVHPDATWARAHPGTFAKDEAWLVIGTTPGCSVLHGTKPEVDKAAFLTALRDQRAHELLRQVSVSTGDVLRIEPGTIHAVGRGCLLLEVQQPSDTTFRVWDYDRRDTVGRPRPLHVEEALAVARFGPQPPSISGRIAEGTASLLTHCYSIDVRAMTAEQELIPRPREEPMVVFVVEGAVTLQAGGQTADLAAGASAIVTASSPALQARSKEPATIAVLSTGG